MLEPREVSEPSPAGALRGRRWLWPVLVLAWGSIAFWAWQAVERLRPRPIRRPPPTVTGRWDAVVAVTGPLRVRLKGLGEVRLAGLAEPRSEAEAAALSARLAELLPPASAVYVEVFPPGRGTESADGLAVTLYVPPSGTDPAAPFPYERATVPAAVLLAEGLARVDRRRPYRFRAEFEMLEDEARRHGRGLWRTGPAGPSVEPRPSSAPSSAPSPVSESGGRRLGDGAPLSEKG